MTVNGAFLLQNVEDRRQKDLDLRSGGLIQQNDELGIVDVIDALGIVEKEHEHIGKAL